ncbi:MAG: TlpA family protein disulfide reductase, partial [Terriglobia bacterium]
TRAGADWVSQSFAPRQPTSPRLAGITALLALLLVCCGLAMAQSGAEMRVLNYIQQNLRPGQPLRVTDLYDHFTQPAERQALGKLYNAFFRIPLFVAQYQEKFRKPPSLEVIAQQFDLPAPRAASILLSIMESDPRVPRFIRRDPHTGEITHVNVQMILKDPRFGHALGPELAGWEGKPAPSFDLMRLRGGALTSDQLRGKVFILYVWFTGCPPCVAEAPDLVALMHRFSPRGFMIVGANADRLLGLGYSDSDRAQYAARMKINFPLVSWTKASNVAYGNVAIFPTLFLVSRRGVVLRHWVGYTGSRELQQAVSKALAG